MKRRILFVDDDSHALSSLRCMVQPMEPEWDMTFAEGGEAALQALGQEAFQVVVTAMRMQGTHGGEVLANVMTRQPSALRIALSGPADRELLARSIGCVHQALPRPCDLDQLVAMVANAAQLANQGVDPDLQGILGRIEHLPSVPGLYQELSALLEGEDATVRRVGDIIRQDVGMTAKILQMVNSAFFGLRRTVEDIQDAVAFLGTDTIKALVLVHGVFDQIGELGTKKISIVDIWVHSLNVAKGARALAAMEGLTRPQRAEAFMGGMLHDVGILILAKQFPQRYDQVVERAIVNKLPVITAERNEFGVAHPEVGAYLLGLWGIQPGVLKAVSLHHTPSKIQATALNPVLAVHVADIICGTPGHHTLFENSRLDDVAINGLGMRERLMGWRQVLAQSGW